VFTCVHVCRVTQSIRNKIKKSGDSVLPLFALLVPFGRTQPAGRDYSNGILRTGLESNAVVFEILMHPVTGYIVIQLPEGAAKTDGERGSFVVK
jgi:hypothetical protein